MAELFQCNKSIISRHIKNVFEEGELNREVVVAKYATTNQHGAIEGKLRPIAHFGAYSSFCRIILSSRYSMAQIAG